MCNKFHEKNSIQLENFVYFQCHKNEIELTKVSICVKFLKSMYVIFSKGYKNVHKVVSVERVLSTDFFHSYPIQ